MRNRTFIACRFFGLEDGVTLLEVLIAGAILSIALIPLHSALSYGFRGVRAGADAATAAALLERAAEEAKGEAGSNFDAFASFPAPVQNYGADQNVGGYTLERNVESGVAGWDGSTGEVKHVTLRIAKDGRYLGSTIFIVHRKGF